MCDTSGRGAGGNAGRSAGNEVKKMGVIFFLFEQHYCVCVCGQRGRRERDDRIECRVSTLGFGLVTGQRFSSARRRMACKHSSGTITPVTESRLSVEILSEYFQKKTGMS